VHGVEDPGARHERAEERERNVASTSVTVQPLRTPFLSVRSAEWSAAVAVSQEEGGVLDGSLQASQPRTCTPPAAEHDGHGQNVHG
jgi:hypothetical protein